MMRNKILLNSCHIPTGHRVFFRSPGKFFAKFNRITTIIERFHKRLITGLPLFVM